MPRKKLSEYRAKKLLYGALGEDYWGLEIDSEQTNWREHLSQLDAAKHYVVKVDQAEKARFKKGLVKLDRTKDELIDDLEELFKLGYQFALVEVYLEHNQSDERYLTIERQRSGLQISFSRSGGIDIENEPDSITSTIYKGEAIEGVDIQTPILNKLVDVFDTNYFSFLEINPLIIKDSKLTLLDAAVEVDSEAQFFEDGWDQADLRAARSSLTYEEQVVQELAAGSQASFSLEVINPDGQIWLILSGGGASVVVADEVNNLGFGKALGNYGEYSGNPNQEETHIYTDAIIKLLLRSSASDKVLIIGGGVANFTDIRVTFKGIIAALKPHEAELKKQGVRIYVRRGGPYQSEGLAAMRQYLEAAGIAGVIAGPELVLTEIVDLALKVGEA